MYYLGIDLGGTNIAAGVVDASYQICAVSSCKTNCPRPAEEIMDDMAKTAADAAAKAGISLSDVAWVGIGSPGIANVETGEIVYSCNLDFHHVPLREGMERRLGRKVYLANDANAAAFGEYMAGAAKGSRSAVAITLGTGVGGGVIIDGKIYTGFDYAGAEIGHMTLVAGGRPCACGRKGCFESYSSATALIAFTKEAMEAAPDSRMWALCQNNLDRVTGRTAFDAMREGDETGRAVVDRYLFYLAEGIVSIDNIFQPEVICIGGGISKEGELLLTPVREKMKAESYSRFCDRKTKVVTASLGNDAGIIGAALLGFAG